METIVAFFDKYVQIPRNISSDQNVTYVLFISLFIAGLLVLIAGNICICYCIRQRKKRELIDYPSNTLQYVRFPRNIRKPYRTSSAASNNQHNNNDSTCSSNRPILASVPQNV